MLYKLLFQSLSNANFFVTPWTVVPQALRPWDFPGRNTGVCCHLLLYGIFLTLRWICLLCLLHCRKSLLSHNLRSHNYINYRCAASVKFIHSGMSDFATPWTSTRQASLSITISRSWLRLMSIESVMPSNHLILCRPLLLLPSIFPSIRVFSNESILNIRWPKYQSFSFRISPSNEYSGLIFFRIDWFDFLAVQGTLKSFLQHSSKASILWHSAFFMVQLSIHTWLLEKPKFD